MEKERVVWSSIFNQPVHGTQNVLLGGLAHSVLLIVGQYDHVLSLVSEVLVEIGRHVLRVIDASSQLALLTKVVDAYQECLASTSAVGVLEGVALRGAVAEALCLGWGRCWCAGSVIVLLVNIVSSRVCCGSR